VSARLERVSGLYPLADDDPRWRHGPRAVVEAALAGGARLVQLRLKHTADGDALALAQWAAARAHEAGALLFVNDRYDLADLAGADGVHLGDRDLAPERLPDAVRARLLVGLSTHTLEQVRASETRPIDYVAFGPVFSTRSVASEWDARGLDLLREARRLVSRPLVAIGGIDLHNIGDVAVAGAAAAAVISVLADADDPAEQTRALQARFESAR
jgi:thiamine-phosphate pyrophosphorylase